MNSNVNNPIKVKGWLLVLCIYNTIINPILLIIGTIVPKNTEGLFSYSNSHQMNLVFQYIILFSAIISLIEFISGIFIWKKKEYAIYFYKFVLIISLIIQIYLNVFSLSVFNEMSYIVIETFFKNLLRDFIWFIIPWQFIKHSADIKKYL